MGEKFLNFLEAADDYATFCAEKVYDQLIDETTHPELAAFLRSGKLPKVAENFSSWAFARIREGNKLVHVHETYGDLAAILKEMDSLAREHGSESGKPQTSENR